MASPPTAIGMDESAIMFSESSAQPKLSLDSDTQLPTVTDSVEIKSPPVLRAPTASWGLRAQHGRSEKIDDVQDITKILKSAKIPACIIDVRALRYFGAGRVTYEWDVCIPTDRLEDAKRLFDEEDQYEPAKPPPQSFGSSRHLNPIYQLKDACFWFILRPSNQCFIDPELHELSKNGIPYPQMPQFARSLLFQQKRSDLADFIDGMNLDQEWAKENLDFEDMQSKGTEFTRTQNAGLIEKGIPVLTEKINYRSTWDGIVNTKDRRIEPMKQGRYKTRWRRIRNDRDPREKAW